MPYRGLMQAFALLALCLSMAGGYWLRSVRADRDLAALQASTALTVAAMARTHAAAVEAARTEEQRRAKEHQDIAQQAQQNADRARRDAAAATDTAGRLREHVARLAAQCASGLAPGHPQLADPSAPAQGPGLVLSDMLIRLEGRGRELAAYADQAQVAGAACERAYEALSASEAQKMQHASK